MECVTYDLGGCDIDMGGGCASARVKTKLTPIRITESTAKLAFVVPRQSGLINPTVKGWTLKVKRGGTDKSIAEYAIAEYDRSTDSAIFFIDNNVRHAPNGYYVGEVFNDCCPVAKLVMYISCAKASSVSVVNFTHDPQPPACENDSLKSADCEKPCEKPQIDVCEECKTC